MRGFLVMILLIFGLSLMNSQTPDFNSVIHYDGSLSVNMMTETNDGNYLVGGRFLASGSRNYDMFLTKYNTKLEVLWSKRIASNDEEWLAGIEQDSAGSIYLCSRSRGFGNVAPISTSLIKLSPEGEFIWGRVLDVPGFVQLFGVQLTGDSLLTTTGKFATTKDGDIFSMIFTAGFKTTGDLSYVRIIDPIYETASRQAITKDGGVIIFSNTIENSLDNQSDTARFYISKLQPDGNIDWINEYVTDAPVARLLNAINPIRMSDGNYWGFAPVGPSTEIPKKHVWGVKVNGETGELLKAVTLSSNSKDFFLDFVNPGEDIEREDRVFFNTRIKNDGNDSNTNFLTATDSNLENPLYYSYDTEDEFYSNYQVLDNSRTTFFSGATFLNSSGTGSDAVWGRINNFFDCKMEKADESEGSLLLIKDVTNRVFQDTLREFNFYSWNEFLELGDSVVSDLELDYSVFTCEETKVLASVDSISVCTDSTVLLSANNDIMYRWFDAKSPDIILGTDDTLRYTIKEKSIDLVVQGYSGTDTVKINLVDCSVPEIEEFYIHRKYTINGDGLNDCLKIKTLEKYKSNHVILYNELGVEVFNEENHVNQTFCFDGLETGLYLLYLKLDDLKEYRESILLKR